MKKLPDYRGVGLSEKQTVEESAYTLEGHVANLIDLLHDVAATNAVLVEQTRELLSDSAAVRQARKNQGGLSF